MLDYVIVARPLWPHKETRRRRPRSTFSASLAATFRLLEDELGHLKATHVDIVLPVSPEQVRRDGQLRAGVRVTHPGVELQFTTPTGERMAFPTDVCETWQHNLRSIALGLEALRAIDRYGMGGRGSQYRGYAQLEQPGVSHGRDLIRRAGSVRGALAAAHPDRKGGSADDFHAVQAAAAVDGIS